MVEIKKVNSIERGEWFTPHVVEPAFGIDRLFGTYSNIHLQRHLKKMMIIIPF